MELDKRKAQLIAWIEENADDVLMSQFEEVRVKAEVDLKQEALQLEHETDLNVVVGSTPTGKPLTKRQMLAKIEKGRQQIATGKYYSTQDIDDAIASWSNGSKVDC